MAKPTGAITAGECYLQLKNTHIAAGTMYMYFVFRVPLMLQDWNDDDETTKYCKIKYSAECIVEDDTVDTELSFIAGNIESTDITYSDIDPIAWQTATEDDNYPGVFNRDVDNGNSYGVAFVEVAITVSAYSEVVDNELSFIGLEAVHDTSNPSGWAQPIQRITANERLYTPDHFLSAWHMQAMLSDTLKHMLANSRPCFAVPMMGLPAGII